MNWPARGPTFKRRIKRGDEKLSRNKAPSTPPQRRIRSNIKERKNFWYGVLLLFFWFPPILIFFSCERNRWPFFPHTAYMSCDNVFCNFRWHHSHRGGRRGELRGPRHLRGSSAGLATTATLECLSGGLLWTRWGVAVFFLGVRGERDVEFFNFV